MPACEFLSRRWRILSHIQLFLVVEGVCFSVACHLFDQHASLESIDVRSRRIGRPQNRVHWNKYIPHASLEVSMYVGALTGLETECYWNER